MCPSNTIIVYISILWSPVHGPPVCRFRHRLSSRGVYEWNQKPKENCYNESLHLLTLLSPCYARTLPTTGQCFVLLDLRPLGPPLKKSLFPVQRVATIKTSREAGISFFFLDNFLSIIKDMENIRKKGRKIPKT